ncbi:MAG: HEPN domain-containing protein [Chloroflexi bacterium]|nr:HEPN domain-containing protein [Chloroflexota bacterium]
MLLERGEETRDWVGKAQQDLRAAQLLATSDPPLVETALYHCQQSAEKAMKAYLVWCDRPFPPTHNLVTLLTFCIADEPGFDILTDAAATLTPYAVAFRYPGEATSPTSAQCEEAMQDAGQVLVFVLDHLPPEVRG